MRVCVSALLAFIIRRWFRRWFMKFFHMSIRTMTHETNKKQLLQWIFTQGFFPLLSNVRWLSSKCILLIHWWIYEYAKWIDQIWRQFDNIGHGEIRTNTLDIYYVKIMSFKIIVFSLGRYVKRLNKYMYFLCNFKKLIVLQK